MLGGVPAYLERFNDQVSLAENVRRHLFRPTGMFRTDPQYLLHDEVQQPHNYLLFYRLLLPEIAHKVKSARLLGWGTLLLI